MATASKPPAPSLSHWRCLRDQRPQSVHTSLVSGQLSPRRQPADQQLLDSINGVNRKNAQVISFVSSRSRPRGAVLPAAVRVEHRAERDQCISSGSVIDVHSTTFGLDQTCAAQLG
jgi:hypothetical protein